VLRSVISLPISLLFGCVRLCFSCFSAILRVLLRWAIWVRNRDFTGVGGSSEK